MHWSMSEQHTCMHPIGVPLDPLRHEQQMYDYTCTQESSKMHLNKLSHDYENLHE